ncbi:hypothetical protein B296_00035260 [Ensete ventricosum]|uniref:Uncharacterized protein n=1 Tax=Ensete ventricosum TaxID=4639 RepID=A0A427A625_ENSVE|nr:hypothetical protein B296_00035260 [Ensete ventricosum]
MANLGRLLIIPNRDDSFPKLLGFNSEFSSSGPLFDEIARFPRYLFKAGPRLGASHKGAAPERAILALEMTARDVVGLGLLVASILWLVPRPSHGRGGACELSVRHSDVLYNYSLASPTDKFPHGVLSEDGYSFSCPHPISLS